MVSGFIIIKFAEGNLHCALTTVTLLACCASNPVLLASFSGRRVGITTGVIGKLESSVPFKLLRRNLKTLRLGLRSTLIRHENVL